MKKFLCILLLFLLCGCSSQKTVMTVDGYAIDNELYRYYYQSMLDEYADEGTAKAEAVEQLRSHVAVIRFAERYGVSLTADESKAIDEQFASFKGRNEDYREVLQKRHLTEDSYLSLCRHDALRQKLMTQLRQEEFALSAEQMKTIIAEEFICARHVFFDATVEGAAQAAAQAAGKLAQGADFDAVFAEYMGEDYSEEPYLFGKGYMVEEFDAAARALAIGQVSGVVNTAYGYHIIQRLPLDDAYIAEHLTSLTEEYVQTQISLAMAQAAAGYEVVEIE